MSKISDESVVLIGSAMEKKADVIGTGFAFYRKQDYTYLITCAHVVEDVGGKENVLVELGDEKIPATIIAIGNKENLDLAVLQVKGLNIPVLELKSLEKAEGKKVKILGNYIFGDEKKRLCKPIEGKVGKKASFSIIKEVAFWELEIKESDLLRKGYSGGPVIDLETNSVLGIATNMKENVQNGKENVQNGYAISVEALKYILPLPSTLLEQSRNFKISPIYSLAALGIGFLLGITPNLFIPKKHPMHIDTINNDNLIINSVKIKNDQGEDVDCDFNHSQKKVESCQVFTKPITLKIEVISENRVAKRMTEPDPFEANIGKDKRIEISDLTKHYKDPDNSSFKIEKIECYKISEKENNVDQRQDHIIFTPKKKFVGNDSFNCLVYDEIDQPTNAKFIVEVKNRSPIGRDDIDYRKNNSSWIIDVLKNDSDRDLGDTLKIINLDDKTTEKGGNFEIVRENPDYGGRDTITYKPPINFTPQDIFRYQIVDSFGGKSELVTVTINSILEDLWKIYPPDIRNFYRDIHSYLKLREWRNADKETYDLMVHIMKNKYSSIENYLELKHIKEFPCEHLHIINQLWKNTSGERSFSFSYQKEVYHKIKRKGTQKDRSKFLQEWSQKLGWFNESGGLSGGQWVGETEWYQNQTKPGFYSMGGMFVGEYLELEYLDIKKVDAHAESLEKCKLIKP
ncbi:MAG: hypothetical protein F6K40_00980 [Okeania sp. SIO3I5]|uniref:GUN4 domain-containing protein n=1 Tax=Okeania sp. SIO3I5 TaxID=2607805 RepID=UPI0013BE2670|nr:GUN4 domain-containing protein [Okeania sp. SIO3I5]NEQ34957.1 hypothetical protein [Okeania sp. SIO3I5]